MSGDIELSGEDYAAIVSKVAQLAAKVVALEAKNAGLKTSLEAAQGALREMWDEVREASAILGGPKEMCLIDRAKVLRLSCDLDREIGSERIELKARADRAESELRRLDGQRCETCRYHHGCGIRQAASDDQCFGCRAHEPKA